MMYLVFCSFELESISETEMRVKDRDYARLEFTKSDNSSEILIEKIGSSSMILNYFREIEVKNEF